MQNMPFLHMLRGYADRECHKVHKAMPKCNYCNKTLQIAQKRIFYSAYANGAFIQHPIGELYKTRPYRGMYEGPTCVDEQAKQAL
jgi:hypothetical protein